MIRFLFLFFVSLLDDENYLKLLQLYETIRTMYVHKNKLKNDAQ